MARTLNLGNVIAQINGNRLLNISATQPVVWTQNGYNATLSVSTATQGSSGLMSASDKTKLDGIQGNAVALGETSTTSYRGDRGKAAYDHSLVVTGNPHHVTKAEVGLSNVPNVATNDQTPTFTTSSTLSALVSGEKMSVSLGKISKVTDTVIAHTADTTIHITSSERGAWNNKVDKITGKGLSTNDFNNDYKTKLDGIEAGAEVNEIYAKDHGLTAGAVVVLSREIEELRKYCSSLEDKIDILTRDAGVRTPRDYVVGKRGFGYCDDPAFYKQSEFEVWVNPSLSGSQLYIQCICNPYSGDYANGAPIISQTMLNQYKIDQYGHGTTESFVVYTPPCRCYWYVTTTAYAWNVANTMSQGKTISANTGAFGVDGFPVNGVDFKLAYHKAIDGEDLPTKTWNKSALGYYDAMAINGYAPKLTKYASVDAAVAGFNNGETVVIEDRWSLDYLMQSNYWLGNRWIRLTTAPPLSIYNGDYYKEEMLPAV